MIWLEALAFIVELVDLADTIGSHVAGHPCKSGEPIPRRSWWLPERIPEETDAKRPIH
jgi:hypothetical protein